MAAPLRGENSVGRLHLTRDKKKQTNSANLKIHRGPVNGNNRPYARLLNYIRFIPKEQKGRGTKR